MKPWTLFHQSCYLHRGKHICDRHGFLGTIRILAPETWRLIKNGPLPCKMNNWYEWNLYNWKSMNAYFFKDTCPVVHTQNKRLSGFYKYGIQRNVSQLIVPLVLKSIKKALNWRLWKTFTYPRFLDRQEFIAMVSGRSTLNWTNRLLNPLYSVHFFEIMNGLGRQPIMNLMEGTVKIPGDF